MLQGDHRVQAVVAEGATNRVFGDKGFLAEYGLRGQVQRGMEWLTYRATALLADADEPAPLREAVTAVAPRRVFLVTAGDVQPGSSTRLSWRAPMQSRGLRRSNVPSEVPSASVCRLAAERDWTHEHTC